MKRRKYFVGIGAVPYFAFETEIEAADFITYMFRLSAGELLLNMVEKV